MQLSTLAKPAFGAQLRMCADANGTNGITVAELGNFSRKRTFATQESTTHATGTPDRTYICTLRSGGVTFVCNVVGDDPTHDHLTGIEYVFENGIERTWEIWPSDGSHGYRFNALISELGDEYVVDGIRKFNVTLMNSGPQVTMAVA